MTMENNKEPLEGFQITDYNPNTEIVTIQIHKSILADERQWDAISKKAIEAIEAGPSVKGVQFDPRE